MSRAVRAVIALVVLSASVLSAGLVAPTTAQAATRVTFTANTSVNIRTKASDSSTILGQLAEGQVVLGAGKVKGKWQPVKYANKTAYAWAAYLTQDATPNPVVTSGPAGKKTVLKKARFRPEASLSAPVSSTLKKGSVVKVSGLASGSFVQAIIGGQPQWVASKYLSKTTDTTPDVVAYYATSAKLTLFAEASESAKAVRTIAAGKKVGSTGVHSGSFTQVVYAGKVGWLITGYLAAVAGTPDSLVLPIATVKLYVTDAGVALRATADASGTQLATLGLTSAIWTTGATSNGFTALIWNGTTAWAASQYLSDTKTVTTDLGTTSLNKLQPYAKAGVLEVRANFPLIKTIYGWRASSAYSDDHPNGRAIDNMVPGYKTAAGIALGDSVAQYFIDNGNRLHVYYVIWRQRNFRIARGYWVKMSDRGGDTANHMDHVHVSFFDSSSSS